MNKKIIIAILFTTIMLFAGFTGLMYAQNTNSNNNANIIKNNTVNNFTNLPDARIIYLISSNGNKTFVTSDLNFLNNNYMDIKVSTSQHLYSKPYNQISFIAPISDFEFSLPVGNNQLIKAQNHSTIHICRYALTDSLNMFSSLTVKVSDKKTELTIIFI